MRSIEAHAASVDNAELSAALRSCKAAFLGVGAMTALINVLYLTGSFFMLEVYDRVIPSRSMPTLVGLVVIAAVLYAFQGLLDIVRARVLSRVGGALDAMLSGRVFTILTQLPLKAPKLGGIPLRDLDQIRGFMSSLGPAALFDLPWMPLYIGICYVFHPLLGLAAALGGCALVALTVLTEVRTRKPVKEAMAYGVHRQALADSSQRNAEVLTAMGMTNRIESHWRDVNSRYIQSTMAAADTTATLGGISKVIRMMLQSGVLAIGAYLVINQQATGGIIIAGSILSARALAPVEAAIANWKGFVGARQSWRRLNDLLRTMPAESSPMRLPRPTAQISLEAVSVIPPSARSLAVQDVTFKLYAGSGLGVIGPSASGKSSLVRAIVGAWPILRGKVRLDGAALDQWSSAQLGPHIGYLPQDVELFGGTIAQNIARFEQGAAPGAVIAAAQAAGVHDLILQLSEGYETEIGEGGTALSAGQRQRVGLARALYGDPFLVVLDEPNSNLDEEGEEALTRAIQGVRRRRGIVIVVAHRPSALAGVDQVLVMVGGRTQAFGPRDEILATVTRRPAAAAAAVSGLKLVGT